MPLKNKQLWVLAGGNSVGKSTFYRTRLEPLGMPFINANIITKQIYPLAPEQNSYSAAKIAEKLRLKLINEGRNFCFETVFSHPSKIDFIAQAKTAGYQIILVFIHLSNTSLNQARISQRVSEGGHSVPKEKIIKRIPRVLKYVKAALPLCNEIYVLENSSANNPFQQLVTIKNNVIIKYQTQLPNWCQILLKTTKI